jgi:hypothetical protein
MQLPGSTSQRLQSTTAAAAAHASTAAAAAAAAHLLPLLLLIVPQLLMMMCCLPAEEPLLLCQTSAVGQTHAASKMLHSMKVHGAVAHPICWWAGTYQQVHTKHCHCMSRAQYHSDTSW